MNPSGVSRPAERRHQRAHPARVGVPVRVLLGRASAAELRRGVAEAHRALHARCGREVHLADAALTGTAAAASLTRDDLLALLR